MRLSVATIMILALSLSACQSTSSKKALPSSQSTAVVNYAGSEAAVVWNGATASVNVSSGGSFSNEDITDLVAAQTGCEATLIAVDQSIPTRTLFRLALVCSVNQKPNS